MHEFCTMSKKMKVDDCMRSVCKRYDIVNTCVYKTTVDYSYLRR